MQGHFLSLELDREVDRADTKVDRVKLLEMVGGWRSVFPCKSRWQTALALSLTRLGMLKLEALPSDIEMLKKQTIFFLE